MRRSLVIACGALAVLGSALVAAILLLHARSRPGLEGKSARRIDENHWLVAEDARDQVLAKIDDFVGTYKLLPIGASPKEKVEGVRIEHIRQGSWLEASGLRVGDVLTAINGTPIDSLSRAVNLLPDYRSSARLDLQVRRDSSVFTFTVEFLSSGERQ